MLVGEPEGGGYADILEAALAREPRITGSVARISPPVGGGLLGLWEMLPGRGNRGASVRSPAHALFLHLEEEAGFRIGVPRSVPTVVSVGEGHAGPSHDPRRGGLRDYLGRRLYQRALARAAAVVAWNGWAAGAVVDRQGIPRSRVHVIPRGVDLELFRPIGRRPPGRVRLLSVGPDAEGVADLVEVVNGLGARVEVDLVSDAHVRGFASGLTWRVHRWLSSSSAELVRLYREADLFVLPARHRLCGQRIAEAMACGLPVVAAAVGPAAELVSPGVNGYLVPPGDVRALAATLEALVADPERRAVLGRWGRIIAEQDHDAFENARTVFDLLLGVAAGRLAATGRGPSTLRHLTPVA